MPGRHFLSLLPQSTMVATAPAFVTRAWAQEGVNAKDLTIGGSGTLTGPLAGYGVNLKAGIEVAIAQINAKSGVHGRALQLKDFAPVYLDKGYRKEISGDARRALAASIVKPVAEVMLAVDGKNTYEVVARTLANKPAAVFLGTAGAESGGSDSAEKSFTFAAHR